MTGTHTRAESGTRTLAAATLEETASPWMSRTTTTVHSAGPPLPAPCAHTLLVHPVGLFRLAVLFFVPPLPPPRRFPFHFPHAPRYDFRQNLDKILRNSEVKEYYTPQAFVREHYGDNNSGKRLLKFVRDNFLDKVHIPEGTTLLLT